MFTVTCLSVLPAHITYIMTHPHLSTAWLQERRFVRSSTLVSLKTSFFETINPRKIWSKFPGNTLSDAMRHFKKKSGKVLASGGLAGRPNTTATSVFLVPVPAPTRHHWGNKLIPVPVSPIRTENRLVFGVLYRHTASTPSTAGTHTSGAQYEGSPQNPDRIEQHSRNGPWTHGCCFEMVYVYVGSGCRNCDCYYYYYDHLLLRVVIIMSRFFFLFFSPPWFLFFFVYSFFGVD